MNETITSTRNQRLKELRALRDRRGRDRGDLFIAEGEDMLTEALRLGSHPETVFFDADALDLGDPPLDALRPGTEAIPVTPHALASAGSLGSGSRLIGVWRRHWTALADMFAAPARAAVYLHDVADPGNVGAVVRSAFAFGAAGVVLSRRAADPFGPKAVRAAMGAVFGLPLARAGWEEVEPAVAAPWRAIGLVPGSGRPLTELAGDAPLLFVLGAERAGLPGDVASACGELAHVPLAEGGAESLNVAMTATLCLYQASIHTLSRDHG